MIVSCVHQSGSIFMMLFASVGMVAAVGVASMNLLKGPVRTMSEVTKRTIAENNMIANGKLSLVMAAQAPGDCDHDGRIEPLEWSDPGTAPAQTNGGLRNLLTILLGGGKFVSALCYLE